MCNCQCECNKPKFDWFSCRVCHTRHNLKICSPFKNNQIPNATWVECPKCHNRDELSILSPFNWK